MSANTVIANPRGALISATETVPLRDLIVHRTAFDAGESLETVHRGFAEHKHEYAAVLDGHRLVGICSRSHVGDRLGLRFGFALFSASPIREFLLPEFLSFRESAPMRSVLTAALSRKGEAFEMDVALVDDDDVYLGMIPVLALVQVQSQIMADQLAYMRAQEELLQQRNAVIRQSEERFRTLVENVSDVVWESDEQGRYTFVSPRMQTLLGYAPQELLGHHLSDVVHPGDVELVRSLFADAARAGQPFRTLEHIELHRDGRPVAVESSGEPIHDRDGRFRGYRGVARDITERQRAAEAQKLLTTAIEQSAETVMVTDAAGTIQYVNPAFQQTTGYQFDEVIGRTPRLLKSGMQDAAVYQQLWDTIKSGQVWKGRLINRRKDGAQYTVEATISPVRDTHGKILRYVAVTRDITYERMIEEQLRQAQKMDAVGQLAGGIAHDFNNLLTVITGYSSLLGERVAANPDSRRLVDEVQKAAGRAAGLTRQLLAFSRHQVLQQRVLNINPVLHGMDGMLRRLIGENIELQTQFDPSLPNIKADAGQIEQVIMNLVVNARDAMPTGGQVRLSTAAVKRTADEFLRVEKEATAAAYCRISVSDTGSGMSDQVKAHLFEPFFTTKGPGKGVGLGLATSYGIIKQCHGHIRVASTPGAGTTFWIYLPAVIEVVAETPRDTDDKTPRNGNGTLLVVEDELALREFAEAILTEGGFQVLTACNGLEGLQRIQEVERVDLIITDVIMPQMSGPEMVKRLRLTHPDQKVMYMSGYSGDTLNRCGELSTSIVFLEKPFTSNQLLHKVREAITSQSGARATPLPVGCAC